jgi:hypothetical protein
MNPAPGICFANIFQLWNLQGISAKDLKTSTPIEGFKYVAFMIWNKHKCRHRAIPMGVVKGRIRPVAIENGASTDVFVRFNMAET